MVDSITKNHNDNFFDMYSLLGQLRKNRPIFHSEADFQHALAWKIHEYFPHAQLRLEYPIQNGTDCRIYLDIRLVLKSLVIGIELKYKTKELHVLHGNESFNLKTQGAQDIGRYDFMKDVQRLEQLARKQQISVGYAVFLTNEYLYWKPRKKNTCDVNFNIHEGRQITANSELCWTEHASEGTTANRTEPILLQNGYSLKWNDYPTLPFPNYFKTLILKISNV